LAVGVSSPSGPSTLYVFPKSIRKCAFDSRRAITTCQPVSVTANKMVGIDLRSDTVTLPSVEMRIAIANAVVGDDVYKEDPTVNELEDTIARLTGKEAGLFVTSGTQGNLIAMLVHCRPGDIVICGDQSHTYVYETAGMSAVGGIMPAILKVQQDGTLLLTDIEKSIKKIDDDHYAHAKLIVLENTQNRLGGVPLSIGYTNEVGALAKKYNVKLHIDGARIFNAAVAFNMPVSDLVASADSVSICLSKGLGAPVGSVLVGNREFIREAKKKRKMLGGGMRQAGILAAAGLVALKNISRLHEDHKKVQALAKGLSMFPEIKIIACNTNILFFQLSESCPVKREDFTAQLKAHGIQFGGFNTTFRAVAHLNITEDMVQEVIRKIGSICLSNTRK